LAHMKTEEQKVLSAIEQLTAELTLIQKHRTEHQNKLNL